GKPREFSYMIHGYGIAFTTDLKKHANVYFMGRGKTPVEWKDSPVPEGEKTRVVATKPQDGESSPRPGRTDIYGDPLPPGATARFGTISLRSDYSKIAFRSDGREFYTWKWDGFLRVHDAADGKALRAFLLPDPTIGPVQFSASGRFLTKGIDFGPG